MALDRLVRRIRNSLLLGGQQFPDAASFLMALINCPDVVLPLKLKAAIALLPFQAVRLDERGKKQTAEERAEEAAQGAYAPPPQLKRPN